jgi:hypothetical protein
MFTDMRKISLYEDEAWIADRTEHMLGISGNRQMRRIFGLEEVNEEDTEI